jgi:anti-sigma regulatory factor (Ser/Thr protein kinase)
MSDSGTRTTSCLELEPHPSSASAARRWVRQQLHAVGHDELVESAELATSELVTNAVLHAQTVVTLSLERQDGRWRFRIGDRSPGRVKMARQEGPARAWGRGLRILDSVSHSWGVESRPPGKQVWFEPRGMSEQPEEIHRPSTDLCPDPAAHGAVLREAPLSLLRQARQRVADLHREMVLMTYAFEADAESAPSTDRAVVLTDRHERSRRLAELAAAIAPITELTAHARGDAPATTITCAYPADTTSEELDTWPDLLDEVDDYCRAEDLLTLPAPRLEALARRWFLLEVACQRCGEQPRSWPEYVATH